MNCYRVRFKGTEGEGEEPKRRRGPPDPSEVLYILAEDILSAATRYPSAVSISYQGPGEPREDEAAVPERP